MHMILALDEKCNTAATDGYRIYFGPKFLDEISDSELDFVMIHEILHVVLQHCQRDGDRDQEIFNIACDIVVNSNILLSNNMNMSSITLKKYGESMHLTPNKDEGYKYTAEEVYEMIQVSPGPGGSNGNNSEGMAASGQGKTPNQQGNQGKTSKQQGNQGGFGLGRAEKTQGQLHGGSCWDDHTRWTIMEDDTTLRDVWVKRTIDAAEAIEIQEASNTRGTLPLFAKRLLKELKKPQTDWRTILVDFIQEEICDYSFSPPDRRFDDSPFFLPDFNGTEISVSDILFMVDTSGSMSDDMITAAFSEIKGAIEQFEGKLKGWIGFFDAAIVEPIPFETVEEFEVIHPVGGGGTDFQIIFEYVHYHMQEKLPASIIILTDGYAPFPDVSLTDEVPVLWLLNNEEVNPPWGKIARIKIK